MIGSPETSVLNHFTPCNNPEDGRINFNRGGSLRSRMVHRKLQVDFTSTVMLNNDLNTRVSISMYFIRTFRFTS